MMNNNYGIYNYNARTGYQYPRAYPSMPSPMAGGWPRGGRGCGCCCTCCPCCCCVPCCCCPPCEECNPGPYTVTFDTNGGTPIPPPQTVPRGGLVSRPADPVLPGFSFVGWFTSAGFSVAPWNFDTDVVVGDMTLFAHWVPITYQVTFETNGGTPIPAPQMVLYGGMAIRPADPARAGYAFAEWYRTPDFSGSPWNFGTDVVTGDMTLYARWQLLT